MKRIILLTISLLIFALVPSLYAQDYRKMMNDTNANFYDIQKKFYEYWKNKEKQLTESEKKLADESEGEYFQFKRWEWFMQSRLGPGGKLTNPAAKALEAWLLEKEKTNNLAQRTTTNGNWQSAGLNSYNYHVGCCDVGGGIGRINCIAFEPGNPSTIYCGTPVGGLWKSTTGGYNWICLTNDIPNLIGVSGIVINPNNTNQIFILTGDGDGGNCPSIGVLQTNDGGNTWATTGLVFNARGYKLLMDPINSNIMFAITSAGIYRTVDGGINWFLAQSGYFFDCEFKPNNHNVMYACTKDSLWKSTNNGNSWTVLINNLPCCPVSKRACIGVSANNPSYIAILYADTNLLFSSIDEGLNWTLKSASPDLGNGSAEQEYYDFNIAIDPVNENNIFIAGVQMHHSTDGGLTWFQSPYGLNEISPNAGYTHVDFHALEFISTMYGSILYAATDGGIYRSQDNGLTFDRLTDGMEITQINYITGTPQNANLLCYGAQDNGTNKFDDVTNQVNLIDGGDGMTCKIDYTNSNIIYTTSQNGISFSKSIDGGCCHTQLNMSPTGGAWVLPFIMDPVNPQILYVGYKNIYKTTNGGSSWDTVLYTNDDQYSMAMGTNNTNVIYSSSFNIFDENGLLISLSKIRKNTIGGYGSWTDITGTLPVYYWVGITSIAVSSLDANKVWVTLSGYTAGFKVFQSTNGGNTWTNISGSLPNVPINCIAFEPGLSLGQGSSVNGLYVGTDIGVYYRNDELGDWVPFKNGMPTVIVYSLYLDAANDKITAGTYGRGIYTSDLFCISDYYLTFLNNPITWGVQHYTCANHIESSVQYIGISGTDIKYNAGSYIDLLPDFKFTAGTLVDFKAYISGCPPAPSLMPGGTWIGSNSLLGNNQEGNYELQSLNVNGDNHFQIIPNPFKTSIDIKMNLDEEGKGRIIIYNVMGLNVKETENKTFAKGLDKISIDLSDVAPGVYFIEINIGDTKTTKKVVKN